MALGRVRLIARLSTAVEKAIAFRLTRCSALCCRSQTSRQVCRGFSEKETLMAGSVNKVILIGNLGSDPEVRAFQNGGKVCNLRIATSESWKDRNTGERQERTEWHAIAIFGEGLVGVAERFLRKGSKVYLEGQLRTRKWQDQSGNDRYSTEVVLQGPGAVMTMLDGLREPTGTKPSPVEHTDPIDDDIPF